MQDASRRDSLARYLKVEVERAVAVGGLLGAAMGVFGGGVVVVAQLAGWADGLFLPGAFGALCGLYSLALSAMGRRARFWGPTGAVLTVGLSGMPTLFFVVAHLTMPAGAATYITGPFSYVYFVTIILSGFLFDARAALVSGVVSGVGYFGVYLLDRQSFTSLVTADPVMRQDMTLPALYAVKAVSMIVAGGLVGALSISFRRIVDRVLVGELEKSRINRLFGQYVSDEVRERIVGAKRAIVAERRQVAVLFSDIRGFSAMSERCAPEAMVGQLNEYFDEMVACVDKAGGVVDKFIGDAVMAVFGGVIELDDPCGAAFRAALAMRARLDVLNQRWTAEGRGGFEAGIGLHYGDVVQGPIGAESRKDFTVIGDAVNTASRIEGFTRDLPFQIVLSASVYDALSDADRARCVAVGTKIPRGMDKTLEVYGVTPP